MRTCEHNGCNRVVFSTDKITRKGYCQYHWKTDRTDLDKRSIIKKAQEKANKKNGVVVEVKETDLQKYFDYHMTNSFPKCENCGMVAEWLLEEKYKSVWKGCQAHVLRKKNSIGGFPSVAANLTNHLVLFPAYGKYLCGCHDEFDSSYEKMAKMKIFPKAIDIINQLYPFIKKEERKYLPDIIIQEIKPEVYNSK